MMPAGNLTSFPGPRSNRFSMMIRLRFEVSKESSFGMSSLISGALTACGSPAAANAKLPIAAQHQDCRAMLTLKLLGKSIQLRLLVYEIDHLARDCHVEGPKCP
jgi:hypothetical protein